MPTPAPFEADFEALHRSDQRAIRTVDSLSAAEWGSPSSLPGWSKAHVVAHLALNAEAFARALTGLHQGHPVPVYPSDDIRDADIATLAGTEPDQIRERFFAATEHFRRVVVELSDEDWGGEVLRLPEGPAWPAADLIRTRQREVEIHHADLGVGYGPADWPSDFCEALLDRVTRDHADSPGSPGFTVSATDLGRTWSVGADTPLITGTAAALGWWLVGRGAGEGLGPAPLPELGPWRRSPQR